MIKTDFKVKWDDKAAKDAVKNMDSALHDAGEYVLDRSNKLVPIDEGTLQASGLVTVDKDTVYISYGTSYAIRQHEDMQLRHKNGRRAKFLSSALKESQTYVLNYLGKVIKSRLK